MRVETERLIIRSFEAKDADGVLRLWANPRANCYAGDKIGTMEKARQRIERSKPEYDLAVCLKQKDTFIGTVFGLREEPDTFSPCWNFLQEYGGKGYAFEAAKACFTYLFEEMVYAFSDNSTLFRAASTCFTDLFILSSAEIACNCIPLLAWSRCNSSSCS